jgi:hypothetical protein
VTLGSWLAVLLFLLFVAPGLLFDLLAQRRRAGLSDSAFRETGRIILASLAFSGAATAILFALSNVGVTWLPEPARLLSQEPSNYARNNYELIAAALLAEVGLALVMVVAAHLVLARTLGGASIRQVSTWTKTFKRDCPDDHDVYVRVRLDDDTVYLGRLANFTADLEVSGRELVLAQPLYVKPKSGQLGPVPATYQRVIIRGDSAVVLSVDYRRKDPSATPALPSWRFRIGSWEIIHHRHDVARL